jgi:predicted patatin/cPLA2 family phospholipase
LGKCPQIYAFFLFNIYNQYIIFDLESPMRWLRIFLLTLLLLISACASVPERNPLPEDLVLEATVLGDETARIWGDKLPEDIDGRMELMRQQMRSSGDAEAFSQAHNYLAISGGGANGAFGAGLLKGWTESGERPDFWIVTGISTGALIAPFAFLGSAYDDKLEALYTGISTSDLVKKRSLLKALTGDAMADTAPMRELLIRYVDKKMVDAIAAEYSKGRRLWIGTTNIDAKRPVIWNIGELSLMGTEASRQMIRDVMLASASIPGAFPPVRIPVLANGQVYDELHVDGGASSQVFLYPAQLDIGKYTAEIGFAGTQKVYVIRNSQLEPRWSAVEPKLRPVLSASIGTLIRTQGIGDLYRIYLGAVRDNMEFNLATMPPEFDATAKESFDPEYMRNLFDVAYELSRNGYPWAKSPPGIELQLQ